MSEKKIIGYITLEDGTQKEVFGKKGKFLICKDTSFFAWRYPIEKAKQDKASKKENDERKDGEE